MAARPNIPLVLTSFVGREREIAEAKQLIVSARLLTLTGAAGCGKTRLALQLATEVSQSFENGVHWVDLARLADPALIPQAIAKALQVAEQYGRTTLEGVLDALDQRRILLVLDNCEHLLRACTELAETMLAATAVSILATSREPLGVIGERRYPVSPMKLPPAGVEPHQLGQFDAIRLFVARARAILPDFALTADNAQAVANICRHLDGVPLAIELASAHINVLTLEQIDARLDDQFALLDAAARVTASHHRTLRAAIDWSYELLSPPEQALLLRLSVFVAGCSLATAEAVCAGQGVERRQVLELLSSLVNKSLVVAQTLQRSEARYLMLETIRQYAHDKLMAAGASSTIRDRHLQCFLHLTEETAPKLSGPYQQLWLNWLEGEYDNIRAALIWSLESGRIETGLRIAIGLYQFWTIRDYVEEGLTWFDQLLAQADQGVSPVVQANALAYASFMAGFRSHVAAQMRYGLEAAVLAEAAGDAGKPALAWALAAQAYGARAAGDFQTGFALGQRGIQLYRELGDSYQLGLNLSITSFTAMSLGNLDAAREMLDEALPLLQEAGNPYRIAMALNFSGDLARCEQDYATAQRSYEESIALLRDLDAARDLASVLQNLGHACLHLGDVQRAHALFSESLALQLAQQNTPGLAECLIGFAALAITCGLPATGLRLLAAAPALGGQRIVSAWAATRMEYQHYLARAHSSLTTTESQAEQSAGSVFTLEQALECAQNLPITETTPAVARKKPDDLTSREREVVALIVHGKSNGEIAGELVVSKRTVEKHIANILSKLGFINRAQIVRWAIETGLVKSNE